MKKLLVLALTLPVFTVIMGGANCAGGGTTCTSDADCDGATNSAGEDTPFCDTEAQICVPDLGECTEDDDCALSNPDSATAASNCSASSDCDAGEECIEDSTGAHYCAEPGEGLCGEIDLEAATFTNTEGDSVEVCVEGGEVCEANGGCTYP